MGASQPQLPGPDSQGILATEPGLQTGRAASAQRGSGLQRQAPLGRNLRLGLGVCGPRGTAGDSAARWPLLARSQQHRPELGQLNLSPDLATRSLRVTRPVTPIITCFTDTGGAGEVEETT